MHIESITPLDSSKGNVANELHLMLDINGNNSEVVSTLAEHKSSARPGTVYLHLIDRNSNQRIRIRFRKPVSIDRQLIDLLSESQISFKIDTAKD